MPYLSNQPREEATRPPLRDEVKMLYGAFLVGFGVDFLINFQYSTLWNELEMRLIWPLVLHAAVVGLATGGFFYGGAALLSYLVKLFAEWPKTPPQTPPESPTGRENGVRVASQPKETEKPHGASEADLGIHLPDNTLILFQNGIVIDHIYRLAKMVGEGGRTISGRRLEEYEVIRRLSTAPPTAGQLIAWLRSHQLIRPVGNNQYEVTELLVDTLRPFSPPPPMGGGVDRVVVQDNHPMGG